MAHSGSAGLLPGQKSMTLGEMSLAVIAALSAVLWVIITANAWTSEYAFHAGLFTLASVASVFLIVNRYQAMV
jgi:cytochrome c oxidase cbb3-type subunit 1